MAANAQTTTGTEAHAPEGGGFPPFNPSTFAPQLVWLALTFAALYIVLSRVALPRIAQVLGERSSRIQRDLDAAERLKTETDKALSAYEQALADAKTNANAIAKDTRASLASEVDKEKAAIDTKVNAMIADAESRIAATKTKALASVTDIAGSTTGAIVSQLLGHDVTADEVKRALAPAAGE